VECVSGIFPLHPNVWEFASAKRGGEAIGMLYKHAQKERESAMRASRGAFANDSLRNSTISSSDLTLRHLLQVASTDRPTAACIVSAEGRAMTWQELSKQLVQTQAALRQLGVGPDDRVALALPNGPTLAAAFLAVASCTACAPLNLSYTADEYEFYLSDLGARILITKRGVAPAAEGVAARLGIPIVELKEDADILGRFSLATSYASDQTAFGTVGSETVALYLYTSGTTSKPKLVPLRHRNLVVSAHNIVTALQLAASDRCLNLMPLFHIHGLMGGLLAPLAAGGSVVCPPSPRPGDFFRWMDATRPAWYTAVPTMHRMVVSEAEANRDVIARCPLRFVRSSSAPLPAQIFDRLTAAFGAPVLEAYSMTEAAHQMTCNPLGSGRQKKGTVGIPAGPEVAVMDATGRLLPQGGTGEIVIRGPSVITAYQDNPEANASAFLDGWFRTGDQGRFDADGYLVLTGRLKEQINRGGEKFAPLEVDQALLAHPDVSEAATFGFPHPTLGQEVAAAVVVREGAETTARDIQAFVRERLAAFKIPRRILIVEAIPKGPTGKVQRSQLHKQLAVRADPPDSTVSLEPRVETGLEADLLRLWREMLKTDAVGADDDFFEKGGDSLLAVEMLFELEKIVGYCIPLSALAEHPTIAELARALKCGGALRAKPLISVQGGDARAPLFFFHGDYDGGYYTRRIAKALGPDQPVISVAPHGLIPEPIPNSIEAMASDRLPLLLEAQPEGPFRLAGYCNGALVAFCLAHMLVESGRQVDTLLLIDPPTLNFRPIARRFFGALAKGFEGIGPEWEKRLPRLARTVDVIWRQTANLKAFRRDPRLLGAVVAKKIGRGPGNSVSPEVRRRDREMARTYNRLFRRYMPMQTQLPLVFFAAENDGNDLRHLCPKVEVVNVPGGHWGCITTHSDALAREIGTRLHALDGSAP
jgi:acyl-CoA synthetase (AMP-forming)/AMP-acid ligase II/thioesterase domain-containing protein/acyl carrier protein